MNVMRLLQMLPSQTQMVEHPMFIERSEVLRSDVTGIFYSVVERGYLIAQGTLMGYVTDFFGKRLYALRAPFAGAMLYILGTPPVSKANRWR